MTDQSTSQATGAQTVTRAIRALKLIARQTYSGMRLVDLARELQLERPTAHRLLKALIAEGMLIQDAVTRRYTLGPLVFELGLASAHQFNLCDICAPILDDLAEHTGDTAFLFVRSGNDAVCLSRVQGKYPIQTPAVPVGSRQPLGVSAGGLVLLSSMTEDEVIKVLAAVGPRLSVYGNLDAEEIRAHCARTQSVGYALIANRAVPGVSGLGLPIRSSNGIAVAAITVAATQTRMTSARVATILPLLRQAAGQITQRLRQ